MKRLLSILLALCMVLALAACGEPAAVRDFDATTASSTETEPSAPLPSETLGTQPVDPVESTITPLLYKVTDEEGHVVWLFGSIHVGLDSFYPLPGYVLDAYESADALAVECDVIAFGEDLSAQMSALRGMLYMDGTSISDHIPEELYESAVAAMKDAGVYMSSLDMYKPILWSSFLDSALYEAIGADSELGIDMHFLSDAKETGKEILEVESVEFQYDMLAGFSEELQILLLEGSVYSYENSEESAEQVTQLIDAWAFGDGDALSGLLNEEPEFESEQEALLYKEYNDAMLTMRNISMADWAEQALASGKTVFICVGAAHVVGPGAMADLLQQRGCTVELITP